VHPLDFPLLTDENIHPDVVGFLREQGATAVYCRGCIQQGKLADTGTTIQN